MHRILYVEPELCSGCRICEAVCSFGKTGSIQPSKSRIKVVNWFHLGLSVPVVCVNCSNPYCAAVCPTQAVYRDHSTGIVKLDDSKCIGCKKCIQACPFGAIFYDQERRVAVKCDLCHGYPLCAQYCPTGAVIYVIPDETGKVKARRIADKVKETLKVGGKAVALRFKP